jgi:homopolymeric O-antigen transport system ATP-binding protein
MTQAIEATELSKRYRIGQMQAAYGTLRDSLVRTAGHLTGRSEPRERQEIWALRDVSFEVREGEALGLIGRNGAGKSTLLKILTRITAPTAGHAVIRGRVGSLLEVGTGFHPELTGTENVYLNGSVLGMKRKEIAKKFPDIVEFAGVERFIETPVKRYSSGMSVRLAFAVAAHLEPEVLLIDEVLAVGDAEFQRRCLGRMEDMSQSGRTVVFVSHQMQALSQLCDRAIELEGGQIVNDGPAGEVVAQYLQSVGGTGASRSWPDLETAPGDGNVLLRSIRVVDETGQLVDAVDVREPVGIEIGFTVRNANLPIFPKIKVVSADGNVAFNAMDTSSRWRESTPSGDYVATAWIPGNLLNEGLTTVEAGVVSLAGMKLFARAMVRDAVSFHVQDLGDGDTARGPFAGQWKGVVRPLLDWTSEER